MVRRGSETTAASPGGGYTQSLFTILAEKAHPFVSNQLACEDAVVEEIENADHDLRAIGDEDIGEQRRGLGAIDAR